MKKIAAYMAFIAGIVFLVLFIPQTAHAAGDVAINTTNFPDSIFRNYVKENFDTNKDNKLSQAEIKSATDIDVSDKGITSLKGLEYLTNLQLLVCAKNELSSFDVTKNTALVKLNCNNNPLTSLNVTKNTALKELYCLFDQLTSLNVTKNTALEKLYCSGNQLTSLDVTKNTALVGLSTYMNQINTLDISHCPTLVALYETGQKNEAGESIVIQDYDEEYTFSHTLYYDKTTKIITTAQNPFTDVKKSDSYYDAVMWAVNNGITSGTSATTFSPNASCTRYQFAVMLYKLNGKPAVGNVTLPFTDVKKTDSYYNAVAWAYTNGIISGTSKTTFSPKDEVTRYQVVAMLYKSVGKPAISTTANPFTDVPQNASYFKAVLWAVEKGITKGTSATAFSPNATCKRYQMVVFLNKFNKIYHLK